jgi:hypothetical protein
MKSADLFWNIIAHYHQQTIWIQMIMISIGAALTFLLYLKPTPIFQSLMKSYLAVSFAWMSIVFFWGMDGSPLSLYFVGPLFLLIAVFFLADIRTRRIHFAWPKSRWQKAVSLLLFALVLAYPLVSFLLGHRYPTLSTPFLPCPLTVFALALLSASLPHIDRKIYILLLVWAMMALPKVFGLFNVREDTILFLVGLYSLVMLIRHWKDTKPISIHPNAETNKPLNQ